MNFMVVTLVLVPGVVMLAFIWYVALSLGDGARLGMEYSVALAVIVTFIVALSVLVAFKLTTKNDETNK